MLAFSTCWNNSRHSDGEELIDEILELGFDTIELSHGMTVAKLPGIQKAWREGKFRCSGVHNYFPSPTEVMIDAPDAYEFTSFRSGDRERAMEMTRRTLEVAAGFEARYLVLHMGSVPLMPHKKWTGQLTQLARDGQIQSDDYRALKVKCVKKREKTGPRYLARAIAALEEIAGLAAEFKVPLAIESRSKYEDVPSEREMITLQEHFKDNPWVGYWHDFGHVQLKHNLRLLDHDTWLGTMQPHLLGAHVHDVHWPHRDHRVPFTGTLDYKNLLRHIPPALPHVWELSPTREAEQIRDALHVWNQLFPETLEG
jgi:sugar phosphate isomerase/epimerase